MRGSSQLTFCMLGKNFSRRHSEIVFLFFPKKLAFFFYFMQIWRQFALHIKPIFLEKKTKKKQSLSSAEFAQGVMAKSMFTDREICLMIRKRSDNI